MKSSHCDVHHDRRIRAVTDGMPGAPPARPLAMPDRLREVKGHAQPHETNGRAAKEISALVSDRILGFGFVLKKKTQTSRKATQYKKRWERHQLPLIHSGTLKMPLSLC
ncbi:hypothetical protein RRG08_030858 [Elysia crispata]|uniref:Uncharacterized protein n=1 Tax=Elysia crispata TaxID=231223 RepID=A0AAE1CLU3_9GAST|nr:hypothetical protein RRG08_030858 [Elysia crispata]